MFSSGDFSTNKETIKNILSNHGYKFTDYENYISCSANYRNVIDTSSVVMYWKDDLVIDYAGGFKGTVKDFLKLVTNQSSKEELEKYLKNNNFTINESVLESKLEDKQVFDKDLLTYLIPDHSYPISRGISKETCDLFKGGYVGGDVKGKQKNRYVLPVFNSKTELIGFTGRTLINDKIKWKHSGNKTDWVWPCFINNKIIYKLKNVILVESPMDCMYLWDNGIKNTICLFGVKLSVSILNYLLRVGARQIIIATNNELDLNGGVGNRASLEIKEKLKRYFDSKNVIIKLPFKKDFCDMSREEIKKYKEELNLILENPIYE